MTKKPVPNNGFQGIVFFSDNHVDEPDGHPLEDPKPLLATEDLEASNEKAGVVTQFFEPIQCCLHFVEFFSQTVTSRRKKFNPTPGLMYGPNVVKVY